MMTILAVLMLVLPPGEAKLLVRVAEEYGLTEEQTYLLAAIRKTEAGKTGLEFGIGQEYPGHRARRYTYSPVRSFLTQAKWCAGTVEKRYTGDVQAFSKIYCPKNAESWAKNVGYWLDKQLQLKKEGADEHTGSM